MNIGFDLDGVLYPWHSSIYSYFEQYRKYTGSYFQFWSTDWKLPEIQEHIGMLTHVPTFCEDREPLPEVMDTLHVIENGGHTVFYITQRPEEVRFATWHYLNRHHFPFEENLYIVDGSKTTLGRSLDLDLYLDDREKNVSEMSAVCLTVLMAQPWNLDFQDKYPTIHNIKEILKFIGD